MDPDNSIEAAPPREAAAIDSLARPADELMTALYQELRTVARARLRRVPPGATLQPTALVHEAYLRLAGAGSAGWNGRSHFFAAAAQAMRCILIDHARTKRRHRRGGGHELVHLEDWDTVRSPELPGADLLALEEALEHLESEEPRQAHIVTLRFFGGLSTEEIAEVLAVSTRTVEREWRFARAWLHRWLDPTGQRSAPPSAAPASGA